MLCIIKIWQQLHHLNNINNNTLLMAALPHILNLTFNFLLVMLILNMNTMLAEYITFNNNSNMLLFNNSRQYITMMAYQQHCQQIEQAIPSGKRMQTKAERRAEHNAIERARRETLNHKFQQLAHSLPNLQNDRRPSKGTIIERTLDFVKNTVMKEEKFLSEIRKLREEQEELTRQLSTGYQTNGSASDADESDGSSTISRGVSSAVDRLSLNSGPCPSLELSTATSPPLQPTSGSDASMLMGSSIPYNHPIPKDAVQNDVMFGQQDPEHNRQQMILSTTTTYESDDDNSSDNLEEIDHAVHDFNCK
ncbi:hypothetical protein BDC45DRAFT_21983 [Circinella umbellata]|nr:hypothetical protein BDC45DRAFT_21983 [Circinella umbellata]